MESGICCFLFVCLIVSSDNGNSKSSDDPRKRSNENRWSEPNLKLANQSATVNLRAMSEKDVHGQDIAEQNVRSSLSFLLFRILSDDFL